MTDNSAQVSTASVESAGARYSGVGFDCADVAELAGFYSAALDLPVLVQTDDFAMVGREGQPGLAFVRIEDYRPPTWPDPAVPKQAHLDLGVDDLDAGQARLVALGAREPSAQPQPERWRVLLDPAGHPFCISAAG
jgi:catechol 2,3-dioxygenase-like lactoylglutathione lyase family enzyme